MPSTPPTPASAPAPASSALAGAAGGYGARGDGGREAFHAEPPREIAARPRLAPHLRLRFDPARGKEVLLGPESIFIPNGSGAAVLALCDGTRSVAQIIARLRDRYDHVDETEVTSFLVRMAQARCVLLDLEDDGAGHPGR